MSKTVTLVKEFKTSRFVLKVFKRSHGGTIKVGCRVRCPEEHNMKYIQKLCVHFYY